MTDITAPRQPAQRLVFILGDQLDAASAVFDDFDAARDTVFMAEVQAESTHVWSAKQRTALFLSAMRHFAKEQQGLGRPTLYVSLEQSSEIGLHGLDEALLWAARQTAATSVVMVEAGDWRVAKCIQQTCAHSGLSLEVRKDRHFLCSIEEFKAYAADKKRHVMEFFYRKMRRQYGYLMVDGEPVGGRWNFDAENRKSLGRQGPQDLPPPVRFEPDSLTRQVLGLVNSKMAEHPGQLEEFGWAVTRRQALECLDDFVLHRLPRFGQYEDAMWTDEPWLYHSQLSAALNLKLLDPREVLDAVQAAYAEGRVPLEAAEGFIRQVLGWREFVRGLYWAQMPGLLEANALKAAEPLPPFFWTGKTEMACLREALTQTLEHGYAHHIQRLMVIGLYAMLLGVEPRQLHEWFLAVYVDAVEWVEAPNTIGMSQYADGGVLATKPYVASGKYIDKMSNYCAGCPYKPELSTGPEACPFTTMYWDFLLRHDALLAGNQRMVLQLKNARRLNDEQRRVIRIQAAEHRVRAQSLPLSAAPPLKQDSLF